MQLTTRGRRTAALFGIALALALPKQVTCMVPGRQCDTVMRDGVACTPRDVEPFGVYLLELATGRDLPIAYSSGLDCSTM